MPFVALQCSSLQCTAGQYNPVQNSAVQYSLLGASPYRSAVQYSTVQYSTVYWEPAHIGVPISLSPSQQTRSDQLSNVTQQCVRKWMSQVGEGAYVLVCIKKSRSKYFSFYQIINRPGVARAVLQSPLLLID